MPSDTDEIPLAGGNVTSGVVRVGNTVRRPVSPHSPSVHQFLLHLERVGFPYSPRLLGLDKQGREILSFIDGTTEFPEDLWENESVITAAAEMLRRFHEASKPFDKLRSNEWAYAYPDKAQHEVICHNDFAPYNMIFRDGLPVGIIDFDLVGPGPRLRDLAYMAYYLTPLSFGSGELGTRTALEVARGLPRLILLLETNGIDASSDLLCMISKVLHHMGSETAAIAMIGREAAGRLNDGGHFLHWQKEATAFDAHAESLALSL